jgi:hypothetical protein
MYNKLIISISISILALTASAQVNLYPWQPNSYNVDPNLDKFVGTWRWVQATDTFEVKMQKGAVHLGGQLNCDVEEIFGWLRYVKNGVLQQSSYQYIGSTFNSGKVQFLAGYYNHPTKQFGSFDDWVNNNYGELYLTMLNANYTQMRFQIKSSRGIRMMGSPPASIGFTVPKDVVLTKQ